MNNDEKEALGRLKEKIELLTVKLSYLSEFEELKESLNQLRDIWKDLDKLSSK